MYGKLLKKKNIAIFVHNALKSFYLDAVKDSIDTKTSPFLAKVEQSSADVYGKDVKNLLTAGRCISSETLMWDITRVIPVCAVWHSKC